MYIKEYLLLIKALCTVIHIDGRDDVLDVDGTFQMSSILSCMLDTLGTRLSFTETQRRERANAFRLWKFRKTATAIT